MPFSHTINGTPLANFATLVDLPAPFGLPELTGDVLRIPYEAGERFGNRTSRGRDYPMTLRVRGETEAAYNDNCVGLLALVMQADAQGNPQSFTLGRTRHSAGGPVSESVTAWYDAGGNIVRRTSGARWMGETTVILRLAGEFA